MNARRRRRRPNSNEMVFASTIEVRSCVTHEFQAREQTVMMVI